MEEASASTSTSSGPEPTVTVPKTLTTTASSPSITVSSTEAKATVNNNPDSELKKKLVQWVTVDKIHPRVLSHRTGVPPRMISDIVKRAGKLLPAYYKVKTVTSQKLSPEGQTSPEPRKQESDGTVNLLQKKKSTEPQV